MQNWKRNSCELFVRMPQGKLCGNPRMKLEGSIRVDLTETDFEMS
jgi:hypothetical protein